METLNFRLLLEPGFAIEIEVLGLVWDLHNPGVFLGLRQLIRERRIELCWQIWNPLEPLLQPLPGDAFTIVYREADNLEIRPWDPAMPRDEDINLETLSFIEADEDLREYGEEYIPCYLPHADDDTPYHMVFRFNGGQIIRIGANSAEFVLTNSFEAS